MDLSDAELRDILSFAVRKEIRVRWRSHVRSFGHGERKSVHRGQGDDFDSHRDYEFGDDVRRISWRILAGFDQLVIKEYKPPTQLNGFVITDISPAMDFGTTRVSKRRLAAELGASCVMSLSKTKDRAGLMYFSRAGFEYYVRPETASMRTAAVAVNATMTRLSSPSDGPPKDGLSETLKRLPFKRSLVFIISDFQHLSEGDWKALYDSGRLHDVICLYVQDERERELPTVARGKGFSDWLNWVSTLGGYIIPLEDFEGNRRYVWNTSGNRRKYKANFLALEAAILTRMKDCNCRWLTVGTWQGSAAWPAIIELFS